MKKLIIGSLVCAAMCPTFADEATFSYSDLREEAAVWGKSTKETYDVAIRLVGDEFTGKSVASFSVPMFACDNITDISVWMSSELKLNNYKKNDPDIVSVSTEIKDDRLNVSFPEPYTITEEGVYVGYSFTVTETGTQAADRPIALTYGSNPNAFYIHTSRSYIKWQERSTILGGSSMISVGLTGDFPKYGAHLSYPYEENISHNSESVSLPINIIYSGTDPVKSLTFELDNGGDKQEYTIDYPSPVVFQVFFDYAETLSFANYLPAGMSYPYLRLTKINGEPNPLAEENPMPLALYSYQDDYPLRRPLIEEYTATSCGWCPRGYVGLERMVAKHGDNFVGVAIHSGDNMDVLSSKNYPNDASSLPMGYVNRKYQINPSESVISEYFDLYTNTFSPIDIQTVATRSENGNGNKILAKTKVKFVRPLVDDYRLFFYLLGDGISSPNWYQNNYFSGRDPETYPGMEEFISQPGKIYGLVYNDVLIQSSDPKGLAGSLPAAADIPLNEWLDCEFEFDLSKVESIRGIKLAEMSSTFHVVAGVVNANTGEVINAIKVPLDNSGINENMDDERVPVSVTYFTIDGYRILSPARGIYLEVRHYSDGSSDTVKRVIN